MRLAAVITARNECDVIESFVRHNAVLLDRLYILDHRSTDATSEILRRLVDEGLPLTVNRDDDGIFYQSAQMNRLIKQAVWDYPWDFVIPLDCDEFLRVPDRAALERALGTVKNGAVGLCDVVTYIPDASDDTGEIDVLRRIVHRAQTIPEISCKIGKVVIPGALCQQQTFSLNEGHHGVRVGGSAVPEQKIDGLSLAHFPVRSIEQFALRAVICRLAWHSRVDYDPSWGWHYRTFYEQLKKKPKVSASDLTEAALLYVDIYLQPGETPHRKVLERDPLTPAYKELKYADLVSLAVLPPILDMAELLVGELRAARPSTIAERPDQRAETAPAAAGERADQARFQSFWHGGALSPYELFCLKSFVDYGHAVDLYSYDSNLVVPPGVRLCNANALLDRDQIFVYQAEGFGHGSPSAFSNIFRYALLAEKGGWWIDTDVVCLTDRIPAGPEFFARQDVNFINGAILRFEPGHPVMRQCHDQAVKLGHIVKWGDAGPRLLTRVLADHGLIDRAAPATLGYPNHYSEALDVLHPAKAATLAARIEASPFLHLWHSMLTHHGVQKSCLPPKGSLLRTLADRHPVTGWAGEYDEQTLEQVVALTAALDAARNSDPQAPALAKENSYLRTALEREIAENGRAQTRLGAILESTSWWLTAPLRAGMQQLRRRR